MRSTLKIAESVPDVDNPFGDDKLERADLSKALTEMISDVEEPLVVALDGAWGTGKTFFLDRWVQEYGQGVMQGKESPCIVSFLQRHYECGTLKCALWFLCPKISCRDG